MEYEEGGDVKRPTPTYKSMDMGGDILDSYLAGLGNSKDTTIKGGGSKKPKPIKKAKGGLFLLVKHKVCIVADDKNKTIDGLTRRQILTIGTTKGVQSLTDAQFDEYQSMRDNQRKGVKNFRGGGAVMAGRGGKFKGVS